MKQNIYGLKDNVTGEFIFTFLVQNEGVCKRAVKGNLLDKSGQNPFCHDVKDKAIFELGSFDTISGQVTPLSTPVFVFSIDEIRQELIREIKLSKAEVGIDNPDADEVVKDEQ